MNKDSLEYKLFLDWWGWYKGHYIIENTDEWWDELIKSGSQIAWKYKDTPVFDMATDLVMVANNQFDRRARNGQL